MNEHDLNRLRHMLEAAQAALFFAEGRERADLTSDLQLAFALVKALEIIGEAVARVTSETQKTLPQIPWPQIIGMRNILVLDHANFDTQMSMIVLLQPALAGFQLT